MKNTNVYYFLGLFFFNFNNIFASGNHSDAYINWWKLGVEHRDCPALGWYSITFIIFIFILIYYGKKIFSEIFYQRSIQIKKDIANSRYLKDMAEKKMKEYNKKIKGLNVELEGILIEFKNKNSNEIKMIDTNLLKLQNQLNNNMNNLMSSHTNQIKLALKKELVNDIISEVLKKLNSDVPDSTKEQYEEKIIHHISDGKINI